MNFIISEYITKDQIDALTACYNRELDLEARRIEQADKTLELKARELTLEENKEARLKAKQG